MTEVGRGNLKLVLIVATFVALAAGSGVATSEASTRSDLNRSLNRIMAVPNGPPGISMQIVKNGNSQYFRRGIADLKSGQKPRIHHRFRVASVAKAFSGAVALNLVARGKLRLDSTIGEVLPGMLPRAKRVTLGQALNHTGGLPEYIRSQGFIRQINRNPALYVRPRTIVSWVRNTPLTHRPGTRYEYSDTDNIVVALMAQWVTGSPYMWQVHRLGRKIGGLNATFMPRSVNMPGPFMHGYEVETGKAPEDISHLINPSGAWASGGIVSTLPNLNRFFRAYVSGRFFGQGHRATVIKRAQRTWMKGESQPAGPGNNWAGMGLFRYVTRCGVMYGHTGSFPGYRVFAASSADGKRSVAFVANAQILKSSPDNRNAAQVSARIRRAQVAAVCHALG